MINNIYFDYIKNKMDEEKHNAISKILYNNFNEVTIIFQEQEGERRAIIQSDENISLILKNSVCDAISGLFGNGVINNLLDLTKNEVKVTINYDSRYIIFTLWGEIECIVTTKDVYIENIDYLTLSNYMSYIKILQLLEENREKMIKLL